MRILLLIRLGRAVAISARRRRWRPISASTCRAQRCAWRTRSGMWGARVNALCCDGYKFSAKHAPQIFGTLYRSTNRDTKFAALLPRVNGMLARKLLPLIEEFRPDVILDTYHFAGQMVSRLKEKGLVSAPTVERCV